MSPLMSQANLASRFMVSETIAGKIAKSSPFGFGGASSAGSDPSALVPEPTPIRAARPVNAAHRMPAESSFPVVPVAIGAVLLGIVAVVVMKKKKKR